tara:strand:- start:205 stop:519 length:315 start_codon:yes stop_codon:yes gene_type:complete
MSNVTRGKLVNISLDTLMGVLPDQGCMELQQDKPHKVHDWHKHDTDETLIIIEGGIIFGIEFDNITCGPGDFITLPAGTCHKSIALGDGCIYTICFRDVSKLLK